jgi:hypothetical protein
MSRFDLETTYLGLDGAGGVTVLPVGPDFWETIEDNPAAGGTLVTVGPARATGRTGRCIRKVRRCWFCSRAACI